MVIRPFLATAFLANCLTGWAGETLFRDDFESGLVPGWTWVRENKEAWRIKDGALEIRVQPGNMWGPENSGRNILLRDLPETNAPLEIILTVQNRPTEQYEQVDLVWYYDDSHMVKIGQELVDGKLSIVMGREEGDKTRTIAIIPIQAHQVQLRFISEADKLQGYYRENGAGEWRHAGEATKPAKGKPRIAIQCYQGPANLEHWARIEDFTIQKE